MSVAYQLGVFCGVGVVILAIIFIKMILFKGNRRPAYDERQKLKQAEAGRRAFYALMACNAIYALISVFPFGAKILPSQGLWACIFVGITWYACDCIWNEAYFAINQKMTRWLVVFLVLGAYNLYCAIAGHSTNIANYFAAAMCFIVCAVALVKNYLIKKEEQHEEP